MNAKRIYLILLLIAGEALIVSSFLFFGRHADQNILILNMIISSVIFLLWFAERFVPIIDVADQSHKDVGSIGLKGVFTLVYAFVAIGVMVVFNLFKPIDITSQILIHCTLFFFLLVGLYFTFYSSQKVKDDYISEAENRNPLIEMKKTTGVVQKDLGQMDGIPAGLIAKLDDLYEKLRFISPSDNKEAHDLENQFLKEMQAIRHYLAETPPDFDKILAALNLCEQAYKERKQIFSN